MKDEGMGVGWRMDEERRPACPPFAASLGQFSPRPRAQQIPYMPIFQLFADFNSFMPPKDNNIER